MPLPVHGHESQHYVKFVTGEGLHAYVLTGVVLTSFRGSGDHYSRDVLTFEVPIPGLPPEKGLRVVHWAPFVGPALIANNGAAINAAWAVDRFWLVNTGPVIATATVGCLLAVRDSDGYLLGLGYSSTSWEPTTTFPSGGSLSRPAGSLAEVDARTGRVRQVSAAMNLTGAALAVGPDAVWVIREDRRSS